MGNGVGDGARGGGGGGEVRGCTESCQISLASVSPEPLSLSSQGDIFDTKI